MPSREEQSLEATIGALAGSVVVIFMFAAMFSASLDYLAQHPQYPVGLIVIAAGAFAIYRLHRAYDRHQRGSGESQRQYAAAQNLLKSIDTVPSEVAEPFFKEQLSRYLPAPPSANLLSVAVRIFNQEQFSLPPPPTGGLVEHAAYRDAVREKVRALQNPQETYDLFLHTLVNALASFRSPLPHSEDASFSVPAIDLIPDVAEAVRDLLANFYQSAVYDRGLFLDMRLVLDANLLRLSEKYLPASQRNAGKYLMPKDHPGQAKEIVDDFLTGTALRDLFYEPIPFGFPAESRFEHTHIVAGSGHGKTQTLQHLILADLASPDPPGLVIIDSQGDMLRKLSRLSAFDPEAGALASKLIVIDPSDVDYPPALNMFDVNLERLGHYNTAAREQILNGVIELYDYIFGSLLGAELTQKQSVIFRYLARLMLTIPGATIHTLIQLMADATPFMHNIAQLPPGARMFFETEFPHKSFAETKRQIQRRLWGILENPTFERMLTAPRNRVDMFDALNSGKIVLVNTAKDFLKAERSSFLGRFFIALTLQAALERAALPEQKRRPAFLYIDEAADYFDDNIDDLLTQARKYKLGVVFSHQYLDQLVPELRSSIASNTSIKMAGGVSDRDARSLASDMRSTPTFILAQHKRQQATQFACYIRNHTAGALSLTLPFGSLERQPTLSQATYDRLVALNRSRISTAAPPVPEPTGVDMPLVNLHSPDLAWKLDPLPNGRIHRIDPNGDVHYEMELKPHDAGTKQAITLNGHTVRVAIPNDVQDGEVLRVMGLGKMTNPDQVPGHLFVTVKLMSVKIGDFVQWESDGVVQFTTPRRVTGIEGHNGQRFAFVQGSRTGIPLSEVRVVQDDDLPVDPSPMKPEHTPSDSDNWSG